MWTASARVRYLISVPSPSAIPNQIANPFLEDGQSGEKKIARESIWRDVIGLLNVTCWIGQIEVNIVSRTTWLHVVAKRRMRRFGSCWRSCILGCPLNYVIIWLGDSQRWWDKLILLTSAKCETRRWTMWWVASCDSSEEYFAHASRFALSD